MNNPKYEQAASLIEASLGWNADSHQSNIDFKIIDIWNVSDRLTYPKDIEPQNYYFIGSRGSGKSSLITHAVQLINSQNQNSPQQTLPMVIPSSSFIAIGDRVHEQTIKNFILAFFNVFLLQLKEYKQYKDVAYWSSIYATYKEWSDFGDLEKELSELRKKNNVTPTPTQPSNLFSSNHLRFTADIAEISFSAIQAGALNIGNVTFNPIKLGIEKTQENTLAFSGNQISEIKGALNSKLGLLDQEITSILGKFIEPCQSESIDKILVYIDDLHFVPALLQLQILHTLKRIAGELRKSNIVLAYKMFSSTNLSPYFGEVLGLTSKDLQVMNIESSLDGLEQKRQAIENLLSSLLKGKLGWTETEYRSLFNRGVVELILVLAGGHPRKFLEICSSLITKSQGVTNQNLYNVIMLSAAEITNKYRRNLSVQIGIENDPFTAQYKQIYENSITTLVNKFQHLDTPFFMIPLTELRNHINLEQWINDAVVIGDLLEIANLDWESDEAYKLLAINPATIYDKLGKNIFKINYQDIFSFQMGAQKTPNQYIPQVSE